VPDHRIDGWAPVPRDVVLVSGRDGGTFLHSQLAHDIASLAIGESRHSLVLEPTGHVSVLARVGRRSDEVWVVDVERGFGRALVDRLSRFVLRARLTIEPCDWECRIHVGAEASAEPIAAHAGRRTTWWGDRPDVTEIVAPADEMPVVDPAAMLDAATVDAMRVDALWPRLGVDFHPGDVPSSTGIVRDAVSFVKGCYPGQELVERMDSRGASAPWELRWLPSAGLAPGDSVHEPDGRAEAGTVTSVGSTRTIARIRRGSSVGLSLADRG